MKKFLSFRITGTLLSILPIALIVIILGTTIVPLSTYDLVVFSISTVLLIVGMELFTRGADQAMLPMGEKVGSSLSKSKKLAYFIIGSLIFGFIITLAEPDLIVLAKQVISMNQWTFIIAASIGASIFMMIAVLRIVFQVKLSTVLFIAYSIVAVLMFFVPKSLLPIALDSGAVTSGPISVPFILALGTGISAVRASKNAKDESFGLIALTSVGPIIVIMILSLFIGTNVDTARDVYVISTQSSFTGLFSDFGRAMLENLWQIFIVLAPIILIFFLLNFKAIKLPKTKIIKIIIGLIYTYVGLALFLTGVSVGYLKVASVVGYTIAFSHYWLLIPLSIVFGLAIVFAEPAIHILNGEVEKITNRVIKKRTMMMTFAVGMAISCALSVLRVIHEIDILYIYLPCVIIMLVLLFFAPKIFTSIAFDSGGVASGSMSASFILPFMIGVSFALGSDILNSAFGVLALNATIPIICVQILGLAYRIIEEKKINKKRKEKKEKVEIIEFDIGGKNE